MKVGNLCHQQQHLARCICRRPVSADLVVVFPGLVHEVLGHGATSIWSQELQWSWCRSWSGDHNAVVHGAGVFERFTIPATVILFDQWRRRRRSRPGLLVDDGVGTDRSLTGFTVTNHQLTLTTTHGDHAINGFQTGLQWLVN